MACSKGKGGAKGRSGRRSLSDEVERARVRQLAWTKTGQFLEAKDAELKDQAWLAVGIVKVDMTKPIVINHEQHTHLTTVTFKYKPNNDLVNFLTGRSNGLPQAEPT